MTTTSILIIEPELIIAEDIKRRLEAEGYAVTSVVGNGHDARMALERHPTDLVLMELMIPDRSTGTKVAVEIMEDHGIPVIVLSTQCHDGTNGGSRKGGGCTIADGGHGSGKDHGNDDRYGILPVDQLCVAKPLDMTELKLVIEKAVRIT